MAEITAITPQKKDKSRCNIEVDGRFYCGMKLEVVVKNRLKTGQSISLEALSSLQLESEKQTALDKALTHISGSMKTEREIISFLQKKGYLPDICDYVVGKMREYGFLDDAEYARRYAEEAGKKKGTRLITLELKRKGIGEDEIEEAVSSLEGASETARAVLEKYMRGKESTQEVLRKAYTRLLAKGFDYDTARSAVKAYGAEDED